MFSFVRAVGKVVAHPLVRWLLIFAFLGWAFDRFVWAITEISWFASVGQSATLRRQLLTQLGAFAGFAAFALALSVGVMRVVARPGTTRDEDELPGPLRFLIVWRRRAARLGWTILTLGIIFIGGAFAARASEFNAALGALEFDAGPFDASLWTNWLPSLEAATGAAWDFSLLAGLVLLVGGALRALPDIAARVPHVPARWTRAVSLLLALVFGLRGARYVWEALRRTAQPLTLDEVALAVPVVLLGALICGLAAVLFVRRDVWMWRNSALKWAVAAFVGPPLLLLLLWPLRVGLRGVEVPALKQFNARATRFAWNLDEVKNPGATRAFQPLRPNWPVWDEATLLRLARAGQAFDQRKQVVEWRRATIYRTNSGWRGLVVGVPATINAFGTDHTADRRTSDAVTVYNLDRVENGLPALDSNAERPLLAFYGFDDHALFARDDNHGGVSIESWPAKIAWALRERNPAILLENPSATRLLVVRDPRYVARKLRSNLLWSVPRPLLREGRLFWRVVGWQTSDKFPGSRAANEGQFAGSNFARARALLEMDAQTGALSWLDPARQSELFPDALDAAQTRISIAEASNNNASAPRLSLVWRDEPRIGAFYARPPDALATLQSAVAKQNGAFRAGMPLEWNGGALVGQPFFDASGALQNVALLNLNAKNQAPIVAPTLDSALAELRLRELPPVRATPNTATPNSSLAARALRAQRAAVEAAKRSDWNTFEREADLAEQLLEQLAAQEVLKDLN